MPKQKRLELTADDVREARDYIEHFWVNLQRYHPRDEDTLIGLPKPYLVPAHDPASTFNFDEIYYWDSYFMVQGMLHDPAKKELVLGILENLFSLLKRFKLIPNASRTYLMGRSQPPLLTSFIFDVYDAYSMDKRWLEQAIGYAQLEYQTVWMGEKKPFWHQVHEGLSRYFDVNMLHDLAETESGWDMTTRFDRRCLDFLPIDLNALLYVYEIDFARAAQLLSKSKEEKQWQTAAAQRKKAVDELMWDKKTGLYYDYDYRHQKRGKVASLAAYVPLWAGMTDTQQTGQLVKQLDRFLCEGGLSATSNGLKLLQKSAGTPTQWSYPNGWAPLHFFVVRGLERAGQSELARAVAFRWLKTNLDWFAAHGVFLEKYNVAKPNQLPKEGVYPSQIGFGWTNAIFERFCQDYIDT